MTLESIAAIAKILGVGMQGHEFVKGLISKKSESDALGLLSIMYKPTHAWKTIHLEYCTLRESMKKLYTETHNSNGLAKRNINPNSIQEVFQEAALYRLVLHLEKDLKSPIEYINESFKPEDVGEQLSKIEEVKILTSLEKIGNVKDQVIRTHEEVCNFFSKVSVIIDKQRWDDTDIAMVMGARRLFKMECDTMIDYTDNAVMGMLDIYEFAFEILLENRKQ